MELYVLRHAIAVQRGTEGYEQDSDRPLTSKGRQKMERIASAMQTLGLSFDLILSSPFLRARQTADVVADVFGTGKNVELSEHLAVGGDPESLVRELNSRFDSLKSVLIVGHEPYLSSLVSTLISGDPELSEYVRELKRREFAQ